MYSNYQTVTTLQELQDETCVEIREAISSITVLHLLQTHWCVSLNTESRKITTCNYKPL